MHTQVLKSVTLGNRVFFYFLSALSIMACVPIVTKTREIELTWKSILSRVHVEQSFFCEDSRIVEASWYYTW